MLTQIGLKEPLQVVINGNSTEKMTIRTQTINHNLLTLKTVLTLHCYVSRIDAADVTDYTAALKIIIDVYG